MLMVFFLLGLAIAGAALAGDPLDPSTITVIDGDTIKTPSEKFRFLGIDTPETQRGQYDCLAEKMLGDLATRFVKARIAGARSVEVERHGQDRYGRTLAHVVVDGESLEDRLLAEGLAGRYEGHRVDWCEKM